MARESRSLEIGPKMAKLSVVPNIGPMLLKQLRTALTTVIKLLLSKLTMKMRKMIIIVYKTRYFKILCWVSLSMTLWLTCRVNTRFGERVDNTWFLAMRTSIKQRTTFKPPAVEPAEPPYTHKNEEDELRKEWPSRGVSKTKAGCSNNIRDLKKWNLQSLREVLIDMKDIKADENRCRCYNNEISSQFFIAKGCFKFPQ